MTTRSRISIRIFLATLLLSICGSGVASTTDDIIKMITAKLPDETILLQVKRTNSSIDLSTDDLVRLKEAGASDELLKELLSNRTLAVPTRIRVRQFPPTDESKLTEPDVLGVPYILDPESGKLFTLERQPINFRTKVKALGYGGATSVYQYEGTRSTIQFPKNSPKQFILRVGSTSALLDPNAALILERLTQRSGHREVIRVKVGPLGIGVRTTVGSTAILLTASKCRLQSLCFSATKMLEPGEYSIRLTLPTMHSFLGSTRIVDWPKDST